MKWEKVMGLEVHLQLSTQSKIFSSSATAFGADANTQTNPLDMALPGTLPVLNHAAVSQAIVFGLGVGAEIGKVSRFDRKNYFYPDLPKGYQYHNFSSQSLKRVSLMYHSRMGQFFQSEFSALTSRRMQESRYTMPFPDTPALT